MTTTTDYKQMLVEGYVRCSEEGELSRLEYLADYVFDFTTYDSEKAEEFAKMALEVCQAITNRTVATYIETPENYRSYLLMCNMPFFAARLNWGTSIRGAWWETPVKFQSVGLWLDGKQLHEEMEFSAAEWERFIGAVAEFAVEPQ